MKIMIFVSRIHYNCLFAEQIQMEISSEIASGTIFIQAHSHQIRNGVFSKAHVCLGLPAWVYIHAPRLTSLLGVGAGAGARPLLSTFSTGGTLDTSAPPGTLSTEPVMSLVSGR